MIFFLARAELRGRWPGDPVEKPICLRLAFFRRVSGERRQDRRLVNGDDPAYEVRVFGAETRRDEAAKTMPDDDRPIELECP